MDLLYCKTATSIVLLLNKTHNVLRIQKRSNFYFSMSEKSYETALPRLVYRHICNLFKCLIYKFVKRLNMN